MRVKGVLRGQNSGRVDEPATVLVPQGGVPLKVTGSTEPGFESSGDPDVIAEVAVDEDTSVTGRYSVIRGELGAEYIYSLCMNVPDEVPDVAGTETGEFPLFSLYEAEPVVDAPALGLPAAAHGVTGDIASLRKIRVLLVNPDPLVLRGLSSLLGDEPDLEVIGCAIRGDLALAQAAELMPDVVILTPDLPDSSGLALVEKLKEVRSTIRPVILATRISDKEFIQARQSGVRGVLLTTMPARLIVQCVKTVYAGEEFLEKETLIKALTLLIRRQNEQGPAHDALTEREREVADLVAAGLSNNEIARRLKVGSGTVKSHLHSVYDKLGVHSRYALMRFAAAQKN